MDHAIRRRAGAVSGVPGVVVGLCLLALASAGTADETGLSIRVGLSPPSPAADETWLITAGFEANVKVGETFDRVFATAVVSEDGVTKHLVHLRDDGIAPDRVAGDGEWRGLMHGGLEPGEYTVRVKGWLDGREVWSDTASVSVVPAPVTPITRALQPRSTENWRRILSGGAMILLLVLGAWALGRRSASLRGSPEVRGEPGTATSGQLARELFGHVAMPAAQLPAMRARMSQGAEIDAEDVMDVASGFTEGLRRIGFEQLGEVGEVVAFDPSRHTAADSGEIEDGAPVRIRYPGYSFGGEVVRHAMVQAESEEAGFTVTGGDR